MDAETTRRFSSIVRRRDELLVWASRLPDHRIDAIDRILLIVLGGLGDTILCEMLFWHLKKERPGRRIEVLTAHSAYVLKCMPTVDLVLLANIDMLCTDTDAMRRCLSFLNQRGYGEAIAVLDMSPFTGMMPAFPGLAMMATRAPVRIGRVSSGNVILRASDGRVHHAPPEMSCITHEFKPGDPRTRPKHESLKARHALGFDYEVPSDRPRILPATGMAAWWAEEIAKRLREGQQRLLVGVSFEVTYELKGWPAERFLQVMRSARTHGLRFIVVGQGSSPARDEIERYLGDDVVDLRGKTDLERLAAITAQCDLFLSADAGPSHLAQALQVPTVVLFGPSNDREFGPRLEARHRLVLSERLCDGTPCVLGPCSFPGGCMGTIGVDAVLNALLDLAQSVREGGVGRRQQFAGAAADLRGLP